MTEWCMYEYDKVKKWKMERFHYQAIFFYICKKIYLYKCGKYTNTSNSNTSWRIGNRQYRLLIFHSWTKQNKSSLDNDDM